MIYDRDLRQTLQAARTQPYRPRTDDPAGFGEARAAAFDLLVSEEQSISGWRWRSPYVEERHKKITQLTGRQDDHLLSAYYGTDENTRKKLEGMIDSGEIRVGEIERTDGGISFGGDRGDMPFALEFGSDSARKWAEKYREQIRAYLTVRALKELDPSILSDQEIDELVSARAGIMRESSMEVLGRVDTAAGKVGQFAGAALGAVTDPPIAASMFAGAGAIRGPSLALNAAKAFGVEAGIAAAAEIPVQAQVWAFKQQIESPWGVGPAAFNVLAASVGAGTIRATGSAAIDLGAMARAGAPLRLVEAERIIAEHLNQPLNADGARQLLRQYDAGVASGRILETEESTRARAELETWADTAEANRLGPERLEDHFDRVEQAMDDIASARTTDAIVGEEEVPVLGGRPVTAEDVVELDPDDILVDAARFQFKAGGDEFGVTSRLQGVREFDPFLAGVVVAWQDRAGRLFIVDGHQRVGLARRARAAGQAVDTTRLKAWVLREADGVTDVQARQQAAIKNIAEGTGSPLDAAKVLRDVGEGAESMMNLPPNSALVRHARGLAQLEDEPFMAVVNDVVPQEYAAIVGERIRGGREQLAVLQLLARTEPANQNQARMIVEQAKAAGFETRQTEDLFGTQDIAESLYLERAKVLDAAMRKLRQDRAAFRTLVSRGTTIEEAGNVLNQEANAARLATDDEILGILGVAANQRGPISDALNDAARRVRDGSRPAAVAQDFLAAVRAEGLRGSAPGAATGRTGPDPQIEKLMLQGEEFARQAGLPPPVRALPDDDPLLLPRNGDTSPERVAMREALVEERFQGAAPVAAGQPKIAYLMGGGGASGKGTVKKLIKDELPEGAVHLDPDEFKTGAKSPHTGAIMNGIPEYREIIGAGDSRAAMVTHEESSDLYKMALARAIEGNYPLVLDRTLGGGEKALAEIQRLKDAGYEVRLVGVSLDTSERYWSDPGYRIFAIDEMTETVAEVLDMQTLQGRAPDQLMAVPVSAFEDPALRAPAGRVTQDAAPPAREPEMDLFGEAPVREQALADANRAVDERLGAGRDHVPAESRGDLFDPGRAAQTDITDARIRAVAEELGMDTPTLTRDEAEALERLMREEGSLIELPDRIELDPDGNPIAVGRRLDEVFSDLDNQGRALDAVELCVTGGRNG